VGTTGLRFFIQFWYAKVPLFWIPEGWLPRYVEWILAFPRAPTGSISVQIWQIACASVIELVRQAVKAVYVLATKTAADQKNAAPQAVPAGGSQKKEL
jgi:tail-anchored protein insertion receptor